MKRRISYERPRQGGLRVIYWNEGLWKWRDGAHSVTVIATIHNSHWVGDNTWQTFQRMYEETGLPLTEQQLDSIRLAAILTAQP